MSIPKEMIILIGALVIAAAVPTADLSSTEAAAVEASPEQRTSHLMRRSGATGEMKVGGGVFLQGVSQATAAFSDTLRHAVRAGEVLIIDLPEELNGTSIESYSLLRAPALSWLIDYSFMWRTLLQDAGSHYIMIRADAPAASDTLVLAIDVQ